MRRSLVFIAAVAAAATAAPALATPSRTPKPQIHDGAGDWAVPSQDILDGTVTATAKTITATVRLAAAPVPGAVTTYAVTFIVGCKAYSASYRWTGVPQTEAASVAEYACPSGGGSTPDVPATQPTATYPATASVSGATFRISFASLPGLHLKTKVYAAAFAETPPATVTSSTDPSKDDIGGDIAFSPQFILGK
jgi:hypothetical protein